MENYLLELLYALTKYLFFISINHCFFKLKRRVEKYDMQKKSKLDM